MKILAIETSCDETAAAVVYNGVRVLGSAIASSASIHAKFGGIVPEIAAREQVKYINPIINEALLLSHETLDSINAIAVTIGPGLIGSLLVGVETAKTIAFTKQKPIIPVNHVLAHMYANFLYNTPPGALSSKSTKALPVLNQLPIEFPAISLVVSGGHTELFLMESENTIKWLGGTLDDAAGEAFDKTARLLGFGNRGGPAIQESAAKHNKSAIVNRQGDISLPRPYLDELNTYNFSFSGLKTAILREVNKLISNQQLNDAAIQQLSHEVQESITDVLVKKTINAARTHSAKSILLSGGVAANLKLREKISSTIQQYKNITIAIPPVSLCTDNAVYIASYAYFRGEIVDWHSITAIPDLSVEI